MEASSIPSVAILQIRTVLSDQPLRWHFGQSVLTNMGGAGEPIFGHDFPPGTDRMAEIQRTVRARKVGDGVGVEIASGLLEVFFLLFENAPCYTVVLGERNVPQQLTIVHSSAVLHDRYDARTPRRVVSIYVCASPVLPQSHGGEHLVHFDGAVL